MILERGDATGSEGLRQARADTGLAVPSLVLGERRDLGGIADAEPAVAAAAVADVERALDWAAELGSDALLVASFGRAELRDGADVDRAGAALRPLCRRGSSATVSLLYEGTLAMPKRSASYGHGRLACVWAATSTRRTWSRAAMDTATELRGLGELVKRVHLKDTRAKVGDCPPGLGSVDFASTARALDEIGSEGWIVLETPPGPRAVGRDLAFQRTVVPRLESCAAVAAVRRLRARDV